MSRTPPRSFVPTLTNEEIMKMPIVEGGLVIDRRRHAYVVTEKGKEYINRGEKS